MRERSTGSGSCWDRNSDNAAVLLFTVGRSRRLVKKMTSSLVTEANWMVLQHCKSYDVADGCTCCKASECYCKPCGPRQASYVSHGACLRDKHMSAILYIRACHYDTVIDQGQ